MSWDGRCHEPASTLERPSGPPPLLWRSEVRPRCRDGRHGQKLCDQRRRSHHVPHAGCVEPSPHLGLPTSRVVAARPPMVLVLEGRTEAAPWSQALKAPLGAW